MKHGSIYVILVILLGVGFWQGLAYLFMPHIHEEIDPYMHESKLFLEQEGMSRVDYMRKTRSDLDRVMRVLQLEAEETLKHENESGTATGQ